MDIGSGGYRFWTVEHDNYTRRYTTARGAKRAAEQYAHEVGATHGNMVMVYFHHKQDGEIKRTEDVGFYMIVR